MEVHGLRNHIATLECLGGSLILNLHMHMMAGSFSLLQNMVSHSQPWMSIVLYFLKRVGVTHGREMIKSSWWQLLNGSIPLKFHHSSRAQHVLVMWAIDEKKCMKLKIYQRLKDKTNV